jgi:hypothetical protein
VGRQLLAVALSGSQSERAARLLGAAEVLREALGARLEGFELALHEQTLATLESRSDPETIRDARASGRNLSLEEAVELARTENQHPWPGSSGVLIARWGAVGWLHPVFFLTPKRVMSLIVV